MRTHLVALLAVLGSGCGPFAHQETDRQWLLPGTGSATCALPAAGPSRPLRVAVYGDVHRGREGHRAVVAAIRRERPDFVIFTGDALDCRPVGHLPDIGAGAYMFPFWPQYYRGQPLFSLLSLVPFPAAVHELFLAGPLPARHATGLNDFLEDTAPLRLEDRTPFVFVPGNHDVFHTFDRGEIARLFGEPGGAGGHDPDALWYSSDLAGVRFIVIDTGTDTPGDREPLAAEGAQMAFLEERLADAERAGMSVVVCGHLPPWASGDDDPPRPAVAEQFGRLLVDHSCVALVLSGHTHRYERLRRDRPADEPATFVVASGGGATAGENAVERVPGSIALVERQYHFVMLEFGPEEIHGRLVVVPVRDGGAASRLASYLPEAPPADEFTIPLARPGRESR